MEDNERKLRSLALKELISSKGGEILLTHIQDEIKYGWDEFIALPVDQKTSKIAFAYQAKYQELKGIKEWIDKEIQLCD